MPSSQFSRRIQKIRAEIKGVLQVQQARASKLRIHLDENSDPVQKSARTESKKLEISAPVVSHRPMYRVFHVLPPKWENLTAAALLYGFFNLQEAMALQSMMHLCISPVRDTLRNFTNRQDRLLLSFLSIVPQANWPSDILWRQLEIQILCHCAPYPKEQREKCFQNTIKSCR